MKITTKFQGFFFGVVCKQLKEIIENKAHNIGLKGVWIDLNDLSKDDGYYFRHCNEVYVDLLKYEEITK